MQSKARRNRQGGFIVSVELLFIVTILVIGLLVGWVAVRDAVVAELSDVAEAVGALDQGYSYSGTTGDTVLPAFTSGGLFVDEPDNAAGVFPYTTITAGDLVAVDVTLPAPLPE
jgi:hypothetical protein